MTAHTKPCFPLKTIVVGIAVTLAVNLVAAQDISLNYERLSSLEEPLAAEIGDWTFLLNGLLDGALTLELQEKNAAEPDFTGNMQLGARTQFSNRWRVGITYFGQYATGRSFPFPAGRDEGYTDNVALSLGGAWGTVIGGNVAGLVREQTRRRRGAGNASLAFDDFLSRLRDWGGGYVVRMGPWVMSAVIDEEANFDLGATFQRPSGNKDYRFTTRYSSGEYDSADGLVRMYGRAVSGTSEVIYGSTIFGLGVAYERLSAGTSNMERWYISSGIHSKVGVLSVSIEGHWGWVGSYEEASAALGLQFDLARGLSANLGLNHAQSTATPDAITYADVKESQAVFSIRYSF